MIFLFLPLCLSRTHIQSLFHALNLVFAKVIYEEKWTKGGTKRTEEEKEKERERQKEREIERDKESETRREKERVCVSENLK